MAYLHRGARWPRRRLDPSFACYIHIFDEFVKRELGCHAYLRYVDDFALLGDSKRELWAWKAAIVERLARLRLVIHETRAQVLPVGAGIPGLGFVVYPTHRLVKARSECRLLGDKQTYRRHGPDFRI